MVFPATWDTEHVGIVPGVITKSSSKYSVSVSMRPPWAWSQGWAKLVCVCTNRLDGVSVA